MNSTAPADNTWSIVNEAAEELVRQLRLDDAIDRENLDRLLNLVPGSLEFLHSFAAYFGRLPSHPEASAPPLLSVAVGRAVSAVAELGLKPVSVEAHFHGFPRFVSALLDSVELALFFEVVLPDERIWTPVSGPLAKSSPHGARLLVRQRSGARASAALCRLCRLLVLCRCISFSQALCIGSAWPDLARQSS